MKNRMTCISLGTVASLLMIMLTAILVAPAHALNSDAMWVDPNTVTLDSSTIGTRFNVTVFLNLTENIYAYQVGLHYNKTLLNCTRAGFTAGLASSYFEGHQTALSTIVIDTSQLGNGSLLAAESALSSDYIPGPKNASLLWIEFQVLNFTAFLPPSGNLTTHLDINTEYPSNTYVLDTDLNNIDLSGFNSTVTFVPEFAYLLLLPIFLTLTLAATIFSRRQQKKSK